VNPNKALDDLLAQLSAENPNREKVAGILENLATWVKAGKNLPVVAYDKDDLTYFVPRKTLYEGPDW